MLPFKVGIAYQLREVEEYQTTLATELGHPVTIDAAIKHWVGAGYAATFRKQLEIREAQILQTCTYSCGIPEECKGFEYCPLELAVVHETLND
ncbi:hypothetical protein HN587_02850 [Candidatus Woesearchaeota archaeon]|jgi:hypothetical protein|nr:hypothetical protein [Candidatus Woesearchaeota archaeon]